MVCCCVHQCAMRCVTMQHKHRLILAGSPWALRALRQGPSRCYHFWLHPACQNCDSSHLPYPNLWTSLCFLLAVLLNIGRQLGVLFQLEIVLLNQRFILLQDKRQAQNIAARGSSVTMGIPAPVELLNSHLWAFLALWPPTCLSSSWAPRWIKNLDMTICIYTVYIRSGVGLFFCQTARAISKITRAISKISRAISKISRAISKISRAISKISRAISKISHATFQISTAISKTSKVSSQTFNKLSKTILSHLQTKNIQLFPN